MSRRKSRTANEAAVPVEDRDFNCDVTALHHLDRSFLRRARNFVRKCNAFAAGMGKSFHRGIGADNALRKRRRAAGFACKCREHRQIDRAALRMQVKQALRDLGSSDPEAL